MLSTLELHLRSNMHRYNVSTKMFCQKCGTVLDIRKSTSIDLMRDGKELVSSYCFCNKCADADMINRATVALKDGYALEIFRGKNKSLEVIK